MIEKFVMYFGAFTCAYYLFWQNDMQEFPVQMLVQMENTL